MLKKLLTLFMSLFMVLLSVPFTVYATEEIKPVINLTVGDELVGEDGTWEQNGTILSYEGTGYTYYTDTEELESGCLVLDGTELDSYYTFQYSGTEEGLLTYEAPGVISLNFVKLDGETTPQNLENLDIVVDAPTQITVRNHEENVRTSYEKDDASRCFGIYAYKEYGDENYSVITITGEKLSISGGETLIGEATGGIFVYSLEIGNGDENGSVSVIGINAESENREGSWLGWLTGIQTLMDITLEKDSSVEIMNLTSSAERFASVEGINAAGAYIEEGATIDIGNLTANAHEGGGLVEIYAVGMNMFEDLENHGIINIGQDDAKIVMNFSNDFDDATVSFSSGSEGICCRGCELLNFGTINVDNIVTNFSTNALGDIDVRMEAYADGIYSQLPISNFSGAVMHSNLADGIELNVNAPKNDNGSYFSYGILNAQAGCCLLAEDAEILGRAGRTNIIAANGSGVSAMGIYSTVLDATDSLVKGMANISETSSEVNNKQLAIVCGELEAKGTSYIFADSRNSGAKEKGAGIEIIETWSLNDDAVIEGFGANNNAITTAESQVMPTLGEDYSPKLEYGQDEKNTNTIYSLDGEEYAKNAYAKISNKNTSYALMEHVVANVGETTLGIVVSDVQEGERYFISIEKDGKEIGTTETITSNGTVKAYLQDGYKLEKGVLYTAKLYKFREKEASKSDFVASLEFDAEEKVPVTGDPNHTVLFVLLMAIAATALLFAGRKLARK